MQSMFGQVCQCVIKQCFIMCGLSDCIALRFSFKLYQTIMLHLIVVFLALSKIILADADVCIYCYDVNLCLCL